MSGRKVDVGGGGTKYVQTKLKNFLPVKTASFDNTNVWGPELQ